MSRPRQTRGAEPTDGRAFDPETVALLNRAFLNAVQRSAVATDVEADQSFKTSLAKILLDLAASGERDPSVLEEQALERIGAEPSSSQASA